MYGRAVVPHSIAFGDAVCAADRVSIPLIAKCAIEWATRPLEGGAFSRDWRVRFAGGVNTVLSEPCQGYIIGEFCVAANR